MRFIKTPAEENRGQCNDQHRQSKRACDLMRFRSEDITERAKEGRPDDAARGIEEKKPLRFETISPGKQSREGPQDGDKTPKKTILPPCLRNKYWPSFNLGSSSLI